MNPLDERIGKAREMVRKLGGYDYLEGLFILCVIDGYQAAIEDGLTGAEAGDDFVQTLRRMADLHRERLYGQTPAEVMQ